MTIPKNVINPFSDVFSETWSLWKLWRLEFDKFKYKGVISEQMALKTLVELSEGDEQKAIKIIEQSIGREWTGFYKLRNSTDNGKSKQSTAKAGAGETSLRNQSEAEFVRRNAERGQSAGDTHLKAV